MNNKILMLEDKLPPELLTEILARTPVKTLLQFRSVFKSWRSIIDNPHFISKNLELSKSNLKMLHILSFDLVINDHNSHSWVLTTHQVDTFKKSGETVLLSQYFDCHCQVKGYVNGLMLILRPPFDDKQGLMLWNPSIQKSLLLPACPIAHPLKTKTILLGFDPSSDNDYKVAVLDPKRSRAAIYDLSKGSWRIKNIQCHPRGLNITLYGNARGVYFKGAVYWVPNNNIRGCDHILVSFDFGSETLRYRDLPDGVVGRQRMFLFIFGESVALYDLHLGGCCIWLMGKGNWTKWYSGDSDLKWYCISEFFYVQKRNMIFINTSGAVHSFHVKKNQLMALQQFDHKVYTRFMDVYVESLVLASASS